MKSLTASGIDAWRPSRTDMQRIPRSKATREREVSIMPTFGFARARHLPEISRVKIATFVSHADELQATYPCYSTTLKRPQPDRSGWSSDLAALRHQGEARFWRRPANSNTSHRSLSVPHSQSADVVGITIDPLFGVVSSCRQMLEATMTLKRCPMHIVAVMALFSFAGEAGAQSQNCRDCVAAHGCSNQFTT